eukprot:Rhum_TRINITY_DN2362_c0_g1::Rhum_TRINITY_DN2362_c0_g1_i1::g.6982::m.6982/K03350/APC3, CDC27; anaphase-promoting complex subunit 3
MVVGVGKGTCRTLERLVADSLDALLYDNAAFYAERLWAIRPNVSSLALLAQTHMATGDFEGAVRVMRHSFPFVEHLRVTKKDRPALMKLYHRYGVCLYKTARLHEAELAFRYVTQHGSAREQSATLYYMGRIFQKTNRDSAEAFSEAVTVYPFNFSATEEYTCEAEKCDARLLEAVYADSRAEEYICSHFNPAAAPAASAFPPPGSDNGPCTPPSCAMDASPSAPSAPLCSPIYPTEHRPVSHHQQSARYHGDPMGSQPCQLPQASAASAPASDTRPVTDAGLRTVLCVLRECSLLLKAANGFQCEEAAARCAAMPAYLRASGFVQGHVGKAYYDNGQHAAAERCFAEMYRLEPFKIDPKLAYYSSCLWQLQRERQLAHLAQELVQMDKLSLVTQIVLGNTHSIVGYHENAIQFFTRACHLDPYHAYSNTLRGMEHLVLEELDDASQAFRTALRLDSRHYPAWHGLGSAAVKQERWSEAVVHFETACNINPNPPLLLAYASALTNEGKSGCRARALETINRILQAEPNHEIALLRKGELLLQTTDTRSGTLEAEQVALQLYELAPHEAQVSLLLGRVYRRLGNNTKAQQYYNDALGLDPKDTPALRYEVERLDDGGESDYD